MKIPREQWKKMTPEERHNHFLDKWLADRVARGKIGVSMERQEKLKEAFPDIFERAKTGQGTTTLPKGKCLIN